MSRRSHGAVTKRALTALLGGHCYSQSNLFRRFHTSLVPNPSKSWPSASIRRFSLARHGRQWVTGNDSPHPLDTEGLSALRPEDIVSASPVDSLSACPGCGAYAQVIESDVAGFYSLKRSAVQKYLKGQPGTATAPSTEDAIYGEAIKHATSGIQQQLSAQSHSVDDVLDHPLCDRCHDLLYHRKGTPIAHPSLESLADTVAESPYKHNHVYHVIDAADFPMSVVPGIQKMLSIAPQRARNRRAKQASFSRGSKTEMSFIITRSDLLAPKKEQVDRLMPYLVETLREALGRSARHVRLGNVRCVSARRGWWTREVKEDIRKRGGGGWMVGKVNVGKSNFFEVVFPKGRSEDIDFDRVRNQARLPQSNPRQSAHRADVSATDPESVLLPPARAETAYPTMPTVSSLPGTTASPIRIPFGNGKGELVDLPGLERSNIADFVRDDEQDNIIMKKHIFPEQHSIKPGSSLVLGGIVRITPLDESLTILAYPFVPLKAHVTKTGKAVEAQEGKRAPISFITKEGVSENLRSAGVFELDTDVTRQRAGPLVAKDAVGLKPERLPFQVLATDILIESIGWVELVAQVRRRETADVIFHPRVEVFTPTGKFAGSRKSMGAWARGNVKQTTTRKRTQPINRRLKERRMASRG